MLATTILRSVLILGSLLAVSASAQAWVESGDAPSFPDGPAQVTRAEVLDTISGSTGVGDLRDAYCIRIVEPDSFLATTDPATWPTANADFDTRLFLFRADGAPVLANDDTPPSQPPYLSTLTGTATDGSGFVLSQPGDYVLIVSGSPDDPKDPTDLNLFDIDSALDGVHAPDPAAGRFDEWAGGAPGTGSYDVVLDGVTPCQNHLDAVFNDSGENRVCLGDGLGGFSCSDISTDTNSSRSVALGFVDGDASLDAVFANHDQVNRVCLGDGQGGFTCDNVSTDEYWSSGVALGFVDGDQNLDAVFANVSYPETEWNQVCLGDGLGGFECSNFGDTGTVSMDVALGFVDGDSNLDAVFPTSRHAGENPVCLGDGLGGFSCSNDSLDYFMSEGVALGFVDGDQNLDAVFATVEGFGDPLPNQVCLGDGLGGFTCSDIGTNVNSYGDVALGLVDGDTYLDAVFSGGSDPDFEPQGNQVCLGDGQGGFTCNNVSTDEYRSSDAALGFVDGDTYLDAVFSGVHDPDFEPKGNQVCLGDGQGGFTCNNVSTNEDRSGGVALGEVDSLVAIPPPLYCFSFDNFCDGIEITAVAPDKTVAATWRNYNCGGETRPMLGGYSGKSLSPSLSWIAGDRNANLDVYSYNLNVDASTFDLFKHDTAFNLIQFQNDEPYTVTPGACPFGPEKAGLPSSMEALGGIPVQGQTLSSEASPFGPDVTLPFCIDFDSFNSGIEVSAVQSDKMIVATGENYDFEGSVAPMLGGFAKGPPRRAYIMGDIGMPAPGDIIVFTLEVDLGTFDLWTQDAAGNMTQVLDNWGYTITNGTCPF